MRDHTTHQSSQEIAYGYCHCGCGQKTPLASRTYSARGVFKGEPNKYIIGHTTKLPDCPPELGPNPSGICLCGCGQPAPIATTNNPRYGQIKGLPMRYVHSHHMRRPVAERFWEKVDKRGPDECWEWTANRYRNNYGCFMLKAGTSIPAHRFAHILTHGSIASDILVCHSCDNPPCCNPAHLWPGTPKENAQDMIAKGRQNRTRKR